MQKILCRAEFDRNSINFSAAIVLLQLSIVEIAFHQHLVVDADIFYVYILLFPAAYTAAHWYIYYIGS